MFTIGIIIIVIGLIMLSRKDKHNKAEDEASIAQLPSFRIQAKPMSALSKFINLAYKKSNLLESFSYSDGEVVVTTQDGKCIRSSLGNLRVYFDNFNGTITYSIKGDGKKMEFYQTTNVSNKEWEAINATLCLSGETRGRNLVSKGAKYVGLIKIAVKAINALS